MWRTDSHRGADLAKAGVPGTGAVHVAGESPQQGGPSRALLLVCPPGLGVLFIVGHICRTGGTSSQEAAVGEAAACTLAPTCLSRNRAGCAWHGPSLLAGRGFTDAPGDAFVSITNKQTPSEIFQPQSTCSRPHLPGARFRRGMRLRPVLSAIPRSLCRQAWKLP